MGSEFFGYGHTWCANIDSMDIPIEQYLAVVIVLVSVLISMTMHEAMHAFTSNWLGDDTAARLGRLTLNPLKHIDPFSTVALPIILYMINLPPFGAAKPVPFNSTRVRYGDFGAALVGLAGPLTNLVLAIVAGLWVRLVIGLDSGIVTETLVLFMVVNLSFFVFNMIPFPPLDGSRVLYAFAPDAVRDIMNRIEAGGLYSIGIFVFLAYGFIGSAVGKLVADISELILGPSVFF